MKYEACARFRFSIVLSYRQIDLIYFIDRCLFKPNLCYVLHQLMPPYIVSLARWKILEEAHSS